MIENSFKNWLEREMTDDYDILRIRMSLSGERDAMLVWKDFEVAHHTEIADMVHEQVRAFMKKKMKPSTPIKS